MSVLYVRVLRSFERTFATRAFWVTTYVLILHLPKLVSQVDLVGVGDARRRREVPGHEAPERPDRRGNGNRRTTPDCGWYASGAFLFVVTPVGLESSLKSSSRKSSSATVCGLRVHDARRVARTRASAVARRVRGRRRREGKRRTFQTRVGFSLRFAAAARRPTRDASFWRLDRRRARSRAFRSRSGGSHGWLVRSPATPGRAKTRRPRLSGRSMICMKSRLGRHLSSARNLVCRPFPWSTSAANLTCKCAANQYVGCSVLSRSSPGGEPRDESSISRFRNGFLRVNPTTSPCPRRSASRATGTRPGVPSRTSVSQRRTRGCGTRFVACRSSTAGARAALGGSRWIGRCRLPPTRRSPKFTTPECPR